MSIRPIARFAFAAALLVGSAPSQAQLFRAYLSASGKDTNPCTLAAPCRLLPAALATVASGGEVWMLDSANYNASTVTVAKSVSILAVPGAVGSLVANGTLALDVTSGNFKVALRNVVLVPVAGTPPAGGLRVTGPASVFLEDSLVANFPAANAIEAGGTDATVYVTNTTLRNNVGGVTVLATGTSRVSIANSRFQGNTTALLVRPDAAVSASAVVVDSVFSNNASSISAWGNAVGATARIFVTRTVVEGADTAAIESFADAGATALISLNGATVVRNPGWGTFAGGGGTATVRSQGNSQVSENGNNLGPITLGQNF